MRTAAFDTGNKKNDKFSKLSAHAGISVQL